VKPRSLVLLVIAALVSCGYLLSRDRSQPAPVRAQSSQAEARELRSGESVSGELRGSELELFKISIRPGRFISVTAEKKDFQLSISIASANLEVRSEYAGRSFGPLHFSFVAENPGPIYLRATSLEKDADPRRFELKIEDLRDATPNDYEAARASLIYSEAEAFRAKWDQQSLRSAIAKYSEALVVWTTVGDIHEQMKTLKSIGEGHFLLSEYKAALEAHMKALALSQDITDAEAELDALNDVGYVQIYLAEKQKALQSLERVLSSPLLQRSNPSIEMRRRKAQALNNTGEGYYSLSQRRKALDYFSRSLEDWSEVGDRRGEALANLNLGYTYTDLGDPQNALEHYQQSLALWRAVGDQKGEAASLTAIGGLQTFLGEKQVALDYHGQALKIFQTIGNREGEAASWNGMAQVYEDLNQPRAALDSYQRALQLNEQIGNRDFTALSRYYVGRANQSLGNSEEALNNYIQGAKLAHDIGNRKFEAHSLRGIGTIYEASGESEKALKQYAEVLSLYSKIGDRRWQARTLNSIGYVKTTKGKYRSAIQEYRKALSLNTSIEDRREEVSTLYNIASAERDAGNFQAALTDIASAVELIESLRLKIVGEQLRTSYFASVHQFYELNVDLLMQTQRHDENVAAALQLSERARARVLLESLIGQKQNSDQGRNQDLLSRERALWQQLNFKLEAQARLLNGNHTENDAATGAAEIRRLTASYQEILDRIKKESPIQASLTQAQVLSTENIRAQARPDTVLLEFALGERRSYVWLVTADSITAYELASRAVIEDRANEVYRLLIARQPVVKEAPADYRRRVEEADASYSSKAAELSQVLFGKVTSQIAGKRLVIVSDGALHRIPFEALPDPDQTQPGNNPIVSNHEVVTVPSFSVLSALQNTQTRAQATRLIAVFADPVFDIDDTASGKTSNVVASTSEEKALAQALRDMGESESGALPRLGASLQEAEAIEELTPADERLIVTGFNANLQTAMDGSLSNFRIIHFATHGLFNDEHPELSGLILSRVDKTGVRQNGFLRTENIYDLDLNADLVVLSACRTGLGRNVSGEGILGMTRGFMYAGSRTVIASLWKVNDEATAELMKYFYVAMFKEGLPPSAALRVAKDKMRKQERWQSPYYWAAFVIQGKYDHSPVLAAASHSNATPMRWLILIVLAISLLLIFGLVWRRKSRHA
jgi:CHAT domain-containing protein/Tfp pilus assembly protein PilF